ncbi:hypothetical protein BOSEA31B_12206 [Hyphomicrobiales bacterium]|nr:hypothetical protein BOSEA31B_12206 [Hyphomicrobiales bacterium]CAH1697986.1 hypothetical protein BOSEA1005_11031 [Hyphomicrobiales bacterium]CAI0347633.1 hypothetical protein BO1005MUT1_70414 [Hyphomicrobiales bacterium]
MTTARSIFVPSNRAGWAAMPQLDSTSANSAIEGSYANFWWPSRTQEIHPPMLVAR